MGIQHPGRHESLLLSKLNTLVVTAIDELNLNSDSKDSQCAPSSSRRRKRDSDDQYSLETLACNLDVNSPFVKHLVRLVIQDATFHNHRSCPAGHLAHDEGSDSDEDGDIHFGASRSPRRRTLIRGIWNASREPEEDDATHMNPLDDLFFAQRTAMRETLRRTRTRSNLNASFNPGGGGGNPMADSATHRTLQYLPSHPQESAPTVVRQLSSSSLSSPPANQRRPHQIEYSPPHVNQSSARPINYSLSPSPSPEPVERQNTSSRSFALATDMLSHHSDLMGRRARTSSNGGEPFSPSGSNVGPSWGLSDLDAGSSSSPQMPPVPSRLMNRLRDFNNFTARRRGEARPEEYDEQHQMRVAYDARRTLSRSGPTYERSVDVAGQDVMTTTMPIAPLPLRRTMNTLAVATNTIGGESSASSEPATFPPANNAGRADEVPRVIITQPTLDQSTDEEESRSERRRDEDDADSVDVGTSA